MNSNELLGAAKTVVIKDQIAELVERLDENGSYALSFYEEYKDDFASCEYLGDMIIQWSGAQVDLRYTSVLMWLRGEGVSVDYIQRAFAEGLVDGTEQDIYKIIQCAQQLYFFEKLNADYATLEQLHKLHCDLAELEREQVA